MVVMVTLDPVMAVVASADRVLDDAAMILVVPGARRVVVREGRRDGGGQKSRARRGNQNTVHSLVPMARWWLELDARYSGRRKD